MKENKSFKMVNVILVLPIRELKKKAHNVLVILVAQNKLLPKKDNVSNVLIIHILLVIILHVAIFVLVEPRYQETVKYVQNVLIMKEHKTMAKLVDLINVLKNKYY